MQGETGQAEARIHGFVEEMLRVLSFYRINGGALKCWMIMVMMTVVVVVVMMIR